jgi:FKBP-type peptidyl-prolyl cis-trans isomerase
MRLSFHKNLLILALSASVLTSCTKEYESVEQLDDRNIQAYLKQSNLSGFQAYANTGMYYQITKPGTGSAMEYSDQVPLVFSFKAIDNSYATTDTIANHYANYLGYFSLEGVRTGVREILKNRGGEIRLIVPSRSAYGRNGSGPIPGNTSIDVTVKALDIAGLPAYEDAMITKYMQANSLTGFTKSTKGIYYKITTAGTGSNIAVDSTVTVNFTGKLLNGSTFDSATGYSSPLAFLVPAWQQILPLIKQGGSVRFITPSPQGYGLKGSSDGTIPGFSPLDFEVSVTDVVGGN